MSGPDDIRAELLLTMADGYRVQPSYFTIPMGFAMQNALRIYEQRFEVERIQLQTKIARLERQLDEALKPAPLKWWQRWKKS